MPYSVARACACAAGILQASFSQLKRISDGQSHAHHVPLSFFDSSCSMPALTVSPYCPREPTAIQRISSFSSSSVAVGKAARKRDEAETAFVSKRLMRWL